jgi:hypothetical protein
MTPQTDPRHYQFTMKNLNQVLTFAKKEKSEKSFRALIKKSAQRF